MQQQHWHFLPHAEVAQVLAADLERGLSDDEAARRIGQHGPNRLAEAPGIPEWKRFASQLVQPLVLVLIVAGTVTALLGEWVDSAVIFGVVVVNAVIGYVQEGRAEAALKALMASVATEVTVVRNGQPVRLPAQQLVPGDLVVLAAGDKVPADLRLARSSELRVDEAGLTGESLPVGKRIDPLAAETPLADRLNMAYSGTAVVAGSGRGIVVATGEHSETGRIARAIADTASLATPLTRQLTSFASQLLLVIGGLAVFTFGVGLWRGESVYAMFMAAVALAVGAIPEGLPAAVTVTLAIGVNRMAKRRAVIRRMPAVEALGSTTVICSDKTGTLTENAMTVRAVFAGGRTLTLGGHGYAPSGEIRLDGLPASADGPWREVLLAGLLCNDAGLHHDGRHWSITGDPTEAALLVAARKAGLDHEVLTRVMPRLAERPFSSEKQWMATLHEIEGSRIVYLKGAVER
ncbi:MAG TPA: HAD-IC family P-type ATPase, partial [Rhodocyclaceae bacterium]|nr:HAD-IC family P-type ATPase [Rhodocyclaceae bacterium]